MAFTLGEWAGRRDTKTSHPQSLNSYLYGSLPLVSGYKIVINLPSTHNPACGPGIEGETCQCF